MKNSIEINAREFFLSCGMAPDDAEKAVNVIEAIFADGETDGSGAGVILMSVTAFIVAIIREGVKHDR